MDLETLIRAAAFVEYTDYVKLLAAKDYHPPPLYIIQEEGEVICHQEQTILEPKITPPTVPKDTIHKRHVKSSSEKKRRNSIRTYFSVLDQLLPKESTTARTDLEILNSAIKNIAVLKQEWQEKEQLLDNLVETNIHRKLKLLQLQGEAGQQHPLTDHSSYFKNPTSSFYKMHETGNENIEILQLSSDDDGPKKTVESNNNDYLITLPKRPTPLFKIGGFKGNIFSRKPANQIAFPLNLSTKNKRAKFPVKNLVLNKPNLNWIHQPSPLVPKPKALLGSEVQHPMLIIQEPIMVLSPPSLNLVQHQIVPEPVLVSNQPHLTPIVPKEDLVQPNFSAVRQQMELEPDLVHSQHVAQQPIPTVPEPDIVLSQPNCNVQQQMQILPNFNTVQQQIIPKPDSGLSQPRLSVAQEPKQDLVLSQPNFNKVQQQIVPEPDLVLSQQNFNPIVPERDFVLSQPIFGAVQQQKELEPDLVQIQQLEQQDLVLSQPKNNTVQQQIVSEPDLVLSQPHFTPIEPEQDLVLSQPIFNAVPQQKELEPDLVQIQQLEQQDLVLRQPKYNTVQQQIVPEPDLVLSQPHFLSQPNFSEVQQQKELEPDLVQSQHVAQQDFVVQPPASRMAEYTSEPPPSYFENPQPTHYLVDLGFLLVEAQHEGKLRENA